jgi:hypothetical protein
MLNLFGCRISRLTRILAFGSGLVELGCVRATEFAAVRIVVEEDTAVLVRTTETESFRVNAAIFNDGAKPLYIGGCGPEAQRRINDKWQTVWWPICVGSLGITEIAPGASLRFPVVVLAYTKPNTEPALDPRFQAGIFRLLFAIGENGSSSTGPNALSLRPSSQFTVVDTTLH